MSQPKDDAEYTADEYEKDDIEVNMEGDLPKNDTSSLDSKDTEKRDIQGIDWDPIMIAREKYRGFRIEHYRNYENIPGSGENSEKECMVTKKEGKYYDFRHNSRSVKSTILHFQLRNLVWASSKHDVYLLSHSSIIHWSSLTSKQTEVFNVAGHVAPSESHPGSHSEGFTGTQVTTLSVKDSLLVAGGFQGELICKNLNRPGVAFCARATSSDENVIINAVEIYGTPSTHLSPDGKQLAIVGDNPDALLVDSRDGKTIASLSGHLDYSFASAWHPNGNTVATGNQDKTCRIWDIRNPSKSLAVLKGNLGAIRSIRYSSDGDYMAMAEPADFVHVYDVKNGYEVEQEIDFFGEISGVSFSPDTESLFIGVWDRTYGSLLEYGRRRN